MAKYVIKYIPEYSLWDAYEYSTLSLSAELIQRLENFDERILDIIDWSDPGEPSPLTKEERLQLYNEGVQLLELVRKEIGSDFEVIDKLGWIYPMD